MSSRGGVKACGLLCLAYLVIGIFFCWPPDGTALADGNGVLPPAVPATCVASPVEVVRTPMLVAGRSTVVYRPLLSDPGAEGAVVTRLAEVVGAQGGMIDPEPAPEPLSAAWQSEPLDACACCPVAAAPDDPGVDLVAAHVIRPTEAITSVWFEVTRLDPGHVDRTIAGTLVYDSVLGRRLEMGDLIDSSAETVARLDALVKAQLLTDEIPGASTEDPISLDRFLLLPDGIGFLVAATDGDGVATKEILVPYRALSGALRAKIGYPGSPDQAYPAYIEIPSPLVVDPGDPDPAQRPSIALTFDDGPDPIGTRAILAELSKHRAVATFCVIGVNAVRHLDILQDIVLQGSEIGNHTWRHWPLSEMPAAEVALEIAKVQRLVLSTTGVAPAFVRPPSGRAGPVARAAFGLPTVYWSIDPYDWRGVSAEVIATHVIERARDGDIVLLHDTGPNTAAATAMILDALAARGFRFVTVSELLNLSSGAVPANSIWRSRAGG